MADDVLARIIEWADTLRPVRVVLLTSSRATPSATLDRYSDYDVIVVVTDVDPFFENREWLKSFGEVLVVYRDAVGREDYEED
jgi:aminoglycoside 6-adenylyltransferase